MDRVKLVYAFTLQEDINAYNACHPELMTVKPLWGAILARWHNSKECIHAMEKWFAYTLRYSRRDQLSLPIALTVLNSAKINKVERNIRESEFHLWPAIDKPENTNVGVDNLEFLVCNAVYKRREFEEAEALGFINRYGFKFSFSNRRMTPQIKEALLLSDYEASEIAMIQKHIISTDRVNEAGVLLGATTMCIADIVGCENISAYAADVHNIALAVENLRLNSLEKAYPFEPGRPRCSSLRLRPA